MADGGEGVNNEVAVSSSRGHERPDAQEEHIAHHTARALESKSCHRGAPSKNVRHECI